MQQTEQRIAYDNLCHRQRNACVRYRLYVRGLRRAAQVLPVGMRGQIVLLGLMENLDATIAEIEEALNDYCPEFIE